VYKNNTQAHLRLGIFEEKIYGLLEIFFEYFMGHGTQILT